MKNLLLILALFVGSSLAQNNEKIDLLEGIRDNENGNKNDSEKKDTQIYLICDSSYVFYPDLKNRIFFEVEPNNVYLNHYSKKSFSFERNKAFAQVTTNMISFTGDIGDYRSTTKINRMNGVMTFTDFDAKSMKKVIAKRNCSKTDSIGYSKKLSAAKAYFEAQDKKKI